MSMNVSLLSLCDITLKNTGFPYQLSKSSLLELYSVKMFPLHRFKYISSILIFLRLASLISVLLSNKTAGLNPEITLLFISSEAVSAT
ncbi:hypothetical protein D3C87_1979850 [compost metagenome]